MKNKTTKHIRYEIACGDGGTISPEQYSKYYKRLSARDHGDKSIREIYGLEQAREHVAELRKTKGEYRKYWSTVPLRIQRVTTITTTLETL